MTCGKCGAETDHLAIQYHDDGTMKAACAACPTHDLPTVQVVKQEAEREIVSAEHTGRTDALVRALRPLIEHHIARECELARLRAGTIPPTVFISDVPKEGHLDDAVERYRLGMIVERVKQFGGNVVRASDSLGISRYTAYRALKKVPRDLGASL